MKFILLVPKLEDVAALRVSIEMWKQSGIRQEMINLKSDSDAVTSLITSWQSNVKKIRKMVMEKVSEFSLPALLKDKVKVALTAVGNEMTEYVLEMFEVFIKHTDVCWTNFISWTIIGTIDKKRTAEAFLAREFFTDQERYMLACKYVCNEDFVSVLWQRLPENINRRVDEISNEERFVSIWCDELVKWDGVVDQFKIRQMVTLSVNKNNMAAFRYFWEKLCLSEKMEERVVSYAELSMDNIPIFSMITIVLLNEMNSREQTKFIETHSFQIVRLFDFWLLRDLFAPTVEKAMALAAMSQEGFCQLLEMTAKKSIDNEWEAWKSEKCILRLWKQSSNDTKKCLIANPPDRLFEYLVIAENFKFITMILDETTAEERRNLFETSSLVTMCKYLVMDGRLEYIVKVLTSLFPACNDELRDFVRIFLHNPEILIGLISKDNLVLIGKLLDYFGDLSAERIVQLKRELVFEVGDEVCRALLFEVSNQVRRPLVFENQFFIVQLSLIDKFLIWGMLKDQEIVEFKKRWIINELNAGMHVCIELLECLKLDIADDILKFCLSSEEDIGEYKRQLMISDSADSMFLVYAHGSNYFTDGKCCDEFVKIIKWFNVKDKETIKSFFENFEATMAFFLDNDFVDDHQYVEKNVEGLQRLVRENALF